MVKSVDLAAFDADVHSTLGDCYIGLWLEDKDPVFLEKAQHHHWISKTLDSKAYHKIKYATTKALR
ncbi:MAG: hypothetical protein ACE5FT_06055 [Candidatus Nanoarchaeia archaeon]